MRNILVAFVLIFCGTAFAQKAEPVYYICGNTGNCTMYWDDFMKCKKVLVPTDKNQKIGSFMLTIMKATKKDTVYVEYPSKGDQFSKSAIESIAELHKNKKMGTKVLIDAVQVLESGKEARKVPGMTITLK